MRPGRCYRGSVRWATLVVIALLGLACDDVREFRGGWAGARVGDVPALRVGAEAATTARLDVLELDLHGLRGALTIEGVVEGGAFTSLPGAEADALAGMTFPGEPLRVYLGFVPVADGGGDVLALIALYDHRRIEVRVLRGGPAPIYAIFALTEAP